MEKERIELINHNHQFQDMCKLDGEVHTSKPLHIDINSESDLPTMVTGIHKFIVVQLVWLSITVIAFKLFLSPFKVFKALRKLEHLRKRFMSTCKIKKLVKMDGRYYWQMHAPGFPSKAFNKHFRSELMQLFSFDITNSITTLFFAITKKCPLRCEHCYEGDTLNDKETLSLTDLKRIVQIFQDRGVTHLQFSGGEPLNRVNEIVELMKTVKPGTDFWIATSGYKLTLDKAIKLKNSGLTGVIISLDHFDPNMHNAFRGCNTSYQWVEKAAQNARKAKLIISLSICTTKAFISKENLMQYASYAQKMGASFIRIFEPISVGNYAEKDVAISEEQEKTLEDFYEKMNYDSKYKNMPLVTYYSYYQRRVGCAGAGGRILYVDANGDLHACPFCQEKKGNVLASSVDHIMNELKGSGCKRFKDAVL